MCGAARWWIPSITCRENKSDYLGGPLEIRLHFSFRGNEKLRFGSVQPSPAALIRAALNDSNLGAERQ